MKVLLYTEGIKTIGKSGLGKAVQHQMQALEDNHIAYTLNPKDDYDIAHINFYGPKSYFLAKKSHKLGKKVVYHAHSTEEDFRNGFRFCKQLSPLFKKWIIKCYQMGDVIVTPTEYSKKMLKNYGIKKNIYAISNGIDTTFFKRNEQLGKKFRETYHYKKEDKVIIGIGLYIERKGIIDFVELAKRMPEYQFIWFGYSPLIAATKEVRKAIKTKLPNLKFAGYVEKEMIRAAMCGCDLYLFPTLEETEGIPIIEAFSCKTNTLVRDIPIFKEFKAGEIVYKASTIDEMEKQIKKIIHHELPSLVDNAYQIALQRDIKKVGKELVEVYSLISK